MEKAIRINHAEKTITLYSGFAKKANVYGSSEYLTLKECRKDYPEYKVEIRSIKKNPSKQKYKNLTYVFMSDYIQKHNPNSMKKFLELRERAACHSPSYSYPTIKRWFLNQFPEIRDFGIEDEATESEIFSETNLREAV